MKQPNGARGRILLRSAVASLGVALGVMGVGTTVAAAPVPPAVIPTIEVTPSSVTPPTETASATATFIVPSTVGYSAIRLSLNIENSEATLSLLNPAGSAELANCAADGPRSYHCDVVGAALTAGGTFTITSTIQTSDPDGVSYPVPAKVKARWSFTPDGSTDLFLGSEATTTVSVQGPSVNPPPELTITATCVDDAVTVGVVAGTNNSVFLINIGPALDLDTDLVAPGTYQFAAGGAANIRVRVLQAPNYNVIFDRTVTCTTSPTTTPAVAGGGNLPATGGPATSGTVLAVTLIGVGGLAALTSRRSARPRRG